MCLEQTINRSLKTSGAIIGNTKRKEFVARWNIIHHELMSVNHTFCKIDGVTFANTELIVNHMFTRKQTQEGEAKVDKMISYVIRYDNPFEVGASSELKLHSFLAKAIMSDEVRKRDWR